MAGYWDRIFLLAFVIHPMSGFEIYAKSEMIVENGTDVRLSCTFKSNQVDQRTLSVYWSFKPGTGGKDQLILYYLAGQSKSQFPDRIAWDGNINKSDVSIIIKNIDFKDNGTYTCQVINPFDYSKTAAEILLSVVEQGSLPKHSIITGAVIGAVVGLLLIIGVVYFIKRKKDGQRNAYISSVENVFPTEQPLRNSAVSGVKDSMNHRSVGPFQVSYNSRYVILLLTLMCFPLIHVILWQGPVIYAQLDHSGQRHSNKIYKSDSVVYSDIQRC